MTGCTPIPPVLHAAAPVVRQAARRHVHYAVSHRAGAVAGHHPVTGHAVPHVPVARRFHPRPHAPAHPAVDTGGCPVNTATSQLRAAPAGLPDAPGTTSPPLETSQLGTNALGPTALGPGGTRLAVLGLGGAGVGVAFATALGTSHPGPSHPGSSHPGSSVPGSFTPGELDPGGPYPGSGGPGGGGPGGGAPTLVVNDQPPGQVRVPEPSAMLVLATALLALALARWRARRRG